MPEQTEGISRRKTWCWNESCVCCGSLTYWVLWSFGLASVDTSCTPLTRIAEYWNTVYVLVCKLRWELFSFLCSNDLHSDGKRWEGEESSKHDQSRSRFRSSCVLLVALDGEIPLEDTVRAPGTSTFSSLCVYRLRTKLSSVGSS